MPVHSRTNWEAALRFAARLGRAWLAGQCFTGLVLDVLDSEMRRPSCNHKARLCSAGACAACAGMHCMCALCWCALRLVPTHTNSGPLLPHLPVSVQSWR